MLAAVYVGDGDASALYLAMYAPHALMAIVFGGRLFFNVRRMLNGESGPWSQAKSINEEATPPRHEAEDAMPPESNYNRLLD